MAMSTNCLTGEFDFEELSSIDLMRIVETMNRDPNPNGQLFMQIQQPQQHFLSHNQHVQHVQHVHDAGVHSHGVQESQQHGNSALCTAAAASPPYAQSRDRHLHTFTAPNRLPQPPPLAPAPAPWVEITEQPKSRGLRFRYECEGRSAGSVPGENSTNEHRTYPTIKIHNYDGPAIIVVSCVTKEPQPHCRPHPHAVVGRDCKKGVCTLRVKDTSDKIVFPQIGIQCAKKKDVEAALKLRKEINVDPFQTGFDHVQSNIDLNVVRLCFQVFLPNEQGKITRVVPPVVSQAIHDKKSSKDLVICRVDRSSGKARGGDEIFLLCDKVNKEDIKVKFYEEDNQGSTVWEDYADFGQGDVHRQYAIVFRSPPYLSPEITKPVEVNMILLRPSDGETSENIPFTYMPDDPDPDRIAEKRKRKAQRLLDFWNTAGGSSNRGCAGSSVRGRLSTMLRGTRRIKTDPDASRGMPQYSMENTGGASATADTTLSLVTADNSSMGSGVTVSSISAGSIDSRIIADLSGLSSSDLSIVSTENGQLVISVSGEGSAQSVDSISLPANMLSGELLNQIDIQQLNAYLQDQASGSEILPSQPTSAEQLHLDPSQHIMDTDLEADTALLGLSAHM
ncbi:hypothetical protein BsWGS_09838 [Bradybaena similaris]